MEKYRFKQKRLVRSLKTIILSQMCMASMTYAEDTVRVLPTIVTTSTQTDTEQMRKFTIDGLGTQDIAKAAASISVITADRIADQHAKVLTDVVKNDASIGDGYAAIGYYPNFVSRGFALDLASSYLINGQAVRGEQNVPLENKERVEILKGISAIQNGMSTPGGVINYVTKRPKEIKALTLAANEHGQYSIATDVGAFLGSQKQLGYRVNLATEQIRPYVEHVKGERYMGALAFDWAINDQSKLEFDLESQRQQQKSVAGYQLLDGKIPQNVKWDRLLGYQSWGKPVTIESLNTNLKYSYILNNNWNMAILGAHSKSKIDDYSNFPWGCYSDICQYSGLGNTFDANGNYDIYDYQNPNDVFVTNQIKAQLNGQLATTWALHQLNFELAQTNKSRNRYGSVNKLIGVGNIYNDTIDFLPTTATVGPRYKALDSKQVALTVLDQIKWNEQWSTLIGGKWINLDEEAYNKKGIQTRKTDLNKFLPQLAVTYNPVEATTLYASYSKGLADGRSAAWFAENADDILVPIHSEQYEIGVKQQIHNFLLTAAFFKLRQDNQYTKPIEDKYWFVAEGEQDSQGLEFGLNGALTESFSLNSSLALTKARLIGIESTAYAGHQAQNVPKLRLATHVSYHIPSIDGLRILAGGQYSSSKFANKEGTARVGGYSVFDLGAAYQFNMKHTDATLRFNINNILNKKYWRDVGEFDGDNYLFLGEPRTANLSLNLNF